MTESKFKYKDENGSTLVETLVAMAILVSVLLPTSLFLGYIAANPLNEEKIIALGLAQTEMEKIIASEKYENHEKTVDDRWIVTNTIIEQEDLVQIEISVYRKKRIEPVVTLTTERLLYENETSE